MKGLMGPEEVKNKMKGVFYKIISEINERTVSGEEYHNMLLRYTDEAFGSRVMENVIHWMLKDCGLKLKSTPKGTTEVYLNECEADKEPIIDKYLEKGINKLGHSKTMPA
jgi:hypothetical protein